MQEKRLHLARRGQESWRRTVAEGLWDCSALREERAHGGDRQEKLSLHEFSNK